MGRNFNKHYSWHGILPYAANGTTECITATTDAGYTYPIPTGVILPTRRVGQLDSDDSRGLGYCYSTSHGIPVKDDLFWSLFPDTMLDALHNESNCKEEAIEVAPVEVAMHATFLLESTTEFINEPETKSPTPSQVLVDPFQFASQSRDVQKPSQSKIKTEPSHTGMPASPTNAEPMETTPAPDRTISATKQSLEASAPPADQNSTPSDSNESGSPESPGANPTTSADETSDSPVARPTTSSKATTASSDQPAASLKTSQLKILNPLIQDVGQHQSSVGLSASTSRKAPTLTLNGVTETPDSSSGYVPDEQTPEAPTSTISDTQISLASQATAIVVGSSTSILGTATHSKDEARQTGKLASDLIFAGKTATLNSASEYVIEDQTLMPGGSAILLSGTRISLAPAATAVVVGSSTSTLAAASSGIGDYVWAGIAGVLSATEDSLSASSEASETKLGSEVVATSTASDGEVVVDTALTAETTASSPADFSSSSTGTSSFASGESSSTSLSPSSVESPDAASIATSTKSVAEVTALVCWMGLFVLFGLQ